MWQPWQGVYSKSAIENFLAGVKVWHLLHTETWNIDKFWMKTLIKAAERLISKTSKRKKRRPCMPAFLEAMHHQLGISNTEPNLLNVAMFACAT